MMKKKIAAVIAALVTAAAASGCGAKTIVNPNEPPPRNDGSNESQSDSSGGAQGGKPTSDENVKPIEGSGGSTRYIKRAEKSVFPSTEDLRQPPEGSDELVLLISMNTVTDYLHAAETYLSLGGKIKVVKTSADGIYDQISVQTASGKKTDIAQFDNHMMFPYGVTQGIVKPTDLAVDYTSKRWEPYRELSDAFSVNNWHYAAVFGCSAKNMLYYNRKMFANNGLSDPETLYENGKWTTEEFVNLLRKWKSLGGKCGIAGHDFEQGLSIGSGNTLISFDRSCAGFSSRVYDPEICVVMNYIYGLKSADLIGTAEGGYDAASAFRAGAMFWSGTYEEGVEYSDSDALGVVPYPTLIAGKERRCYEAEYDGLVLLSGAEDMSAVRAYFECAREESHARTGSLAEKFTPDGEAIYEYGMGISPKMSDSASGANTNFTKALIPLMYKDGYSIGEWDDRVCFGLSPMINEELATVNNAIADKVFDRSKEKETKPKTKKKN